MQRITTDVLVIGGGATGTGVLRDLALRGIGAILVEKGDLTHGTTGRYHGLLHSGGRYVVKDPQSATECARENAILRRIMPHCIEDTSGFFVSTPWDDPAYGDRFLAGCRATGVPVSEIPISEALRREPLLNPHISRVFEVPDGAADAFLATRANAEDARRNGARVLTYHNVVALLDDRGRVAGAEAENLRSGERVRIEARVVLNAAGAWAGKIAALAGVRVTVVPGKGTMVAMNHRMVNTVVNRCKLPADGDIIVPIRTVAVIGTTDVSVPDPDVYGIEPHEIELMMQEGERLIPGFRRYRALRAWAGVRPLYKDQDVHDDRDISRTYKLLDHAARDGVPGLVSMVGGKWTTYRLMAQEAVDRIAQELGTTRPCRTHEEVLPGGESGALFTAGMPLATVEHNDTYGELICECELVTRQRVIDAIHAEGVSNLDDVRRETRLGMGPCQGGFCMYRAAALWAETRGSQPPAAPAHAAGAEGAALLRHFLQERWKGLTPVLWGEQLQQARLDEIIYLHVLGVQRLPGTLATGLVTDHPAIATEYHND